MGGIYLVQGDDSLLEMREAAYDSEDILQTLLAKYPNLLAGDQMDSAEPRRWLLIAREMGIPSNELDGGRWAIDHLFLDQDGIPTLVEVKRSSDTRLRREVVGQLLEYAANAVAYWPMERIRAEYEAHCERCQTDAGEQLAQFLGADRDPETFWETVDTNLHAGKVRLVFVADVIPRELRRIVEFLNEQMSPADVLAVEVKQYVGGELQTLVPRLIGATERKAPRGSREKKKWTEEAFFEDLSANGGEPFVPVVRRLLAELRAIPGTSIWWGQGATTATFVPCIAFEGKDVGLFRVVSRGARIEIYFAMLKNYGAFRNVGKRRELRARYNEIPGLQISEDAVSRYPTFPIQTLANDAALSRFLEVQRWVVTEIGKP